MPSEGCHRPLLKSCCAPHIRASSEWGNLLCRSSWVNSSPSGTIPISGSGRCARSPDASLSPRRTLGTTSKWRVTGSTGESVTGVTFESIGIHIPNSRVLPPIYTAGVCQGRLSRRAAAGALQARSGWQRCKTHLHASTPWAFSSATPAASSSDERCAGSGVSTLCRGRSPGARDPINATVAAIAMIQASNSEDLMRIRTVTCARADWPKGSLLGGSVNRGTNL